jgi:hypothetical protein
MFLKAAELYASQMTPMLKVLLIAAASAIARPWIKPAACFTACAAFWLLASTINIMYYSVATRGYEAPAARGLYAPLQRVVAEQRIPYSIYAKDMYAREIHEANIGGRVCKISSRHPAVCMPRNIGSGFPAHIENGVVQ